MALPARAGTHLEYTAGGHLVPADQRLDELDQVDVPTLVARPAYGHDTTGTISGVAAVQPNPFEFYLQPGDRIEAEIEGVGVLRNHVVPWAAAHSTPPYSTDLYSSTS